MARCYVGLDVHSKMTSFVIQEDGGQVRARGLVPTTLEGLRLLRTQYGVPKGTRVGLESGTMANYVCRQLRQLELEPVVISAYEVRRKAQRPRQKNDQRDAFEVCDGLRRDQYRSIVYQPPVEIQVLRKTLSQRRHFVGIQTGEVNAVKHHLRAAGLQHLRCPLQVESAWEKLLSRIEDVELLATLKRHHQTWRVACEQGAALEALLLEQSKLFEADFLRAQTMPGVGPIVALTVLATYGDVGRFPDCKHASSYGGMIPSSSDSGDRRRGGPITKQGSAELRAMLCEAAHHASRKTHPLNPYFGKMCARQGYKMAVMTIAHRMCRILFAMLRDKTDFDISKLNIEVGPFEQKIVRPYRLRQRMTPRRA